jgi:hypothetical protein
MSNWSSFLHKLGRFMFNCKSNEGLRPAVIISLPCLDYASVIISSGMIAERFENRKRISKSPNEWGNSLNAAVCFPRVRVVDGCQNLYISKGTIDSIQSYMGEERLHVKWVENRNLTQTRAVENRWLPLVSPLDDVPSIERKKIGSILARHVQSLEMILGESGLCFLVEKSHDSVCIIDTKSRVIAEVKQQISLSKLGLKHDNLNLAIRDLVRLDVEGGEAMADTYCCKVSSEAESGWPATVMSGSLRFLKHWDDSDSPIRVAIISPTETSYTEAISFANNLFSQRAPGELNLPDDLLREKPASIDIQLMNTR